ncbi:VPS36 [Candida jiufengensis]|uniref:VPS36 n=1 Tax=Candida jiufengensis TaxID=497108 RepID=UPI002224A561|nr:VPS36 [Candida jiufengensis]KAI5951923.1 VPS36 [Candida jiufengensis]
MFESIIKNYNYYLNYFKSIKLSNLSKQFNLFKSTTTTPSVKDLKDKPKEKKRTCFLCKEPCFICREIRPIKSEIKKSFKNSYFVKHNPSKYIKGEIHNIKPDLYKSFKKSSLLKHSKFVKSEIKNIRPDIVKSFKEIHSPDFIVFDPPPKKPPLPPKETDIKPVVLFLELIILMALPFYFIVKYIEQLTSAELVEKFLRSSPKVKLYIKTEIPKKNEEIKGIDWVCKICSFNNHIPSGFNWDEEELPKCISCGIRPTKKYIEEIANSSKESTPASTEPIISESNNFQTSPSPAVSTSESTLANGQCPTCTFINHRYVKFCEMCGTELSSSSTSELSQSMNDISLETNPMKLKLESPELYTNNKPYVKISFRKGGEQKFFQEVANLIDEIKWDNLRKKGGINQNSKKLQQPKLEIKRTGAGIHALELIGEQQRKNNEVILSSSLEDLEQLMFKFKDILHLSSSFNGLINNKVNITKSLPPINISKSSNLYHNELSRHISEYLVNFKLIKNSSMITLQDLFADYNRFLVKSQGFGCELVDVNDFQKSVDLFDSLNLPVVQNKYEKSDLVVIKPRIHTNAYDEFIVSYLNNQEHQYKINKLRVEMIDDNEYDRDYSGHENGNYGCTISEISHFFNWSYNITKEELEKSIENGQIVIDQNISGTFYYVNKFSSTFNWDNSKEIEQIKEDIVKEQDEITKNMKSEYERLKLNNLVNLNPEYEFGTINDEQSIVSESTPVTSHIPSTISLNGLEGLQF